MFLFKNYPTFIELRATNWFQVFFKAGILASMEDFRDEALSKVLTGLQAAIRWHLGVVSFQTH